MNHNANAAISKESVAQVMVLLKEPVRDYFELEARSESFHAEVKSLIANTVKSTMRGPELPKLIRQLVSDAAADIAKEVLAEMLADLDTKVRELVANHFDDAVGRTVRDILDKALRDVLNKMCGTGANR